MKNPNLNKIIAENLEKDRFQSKSVPSLPTDSWLNQYKKGGGMFPEYDSWAPPRHANGGLVQYELGGDECKDAQGNVIPCDQQKLQEYGSDAYTAMAPFYETLYGAANKYKNERTGKVSDFNSARATAKAFLKHPEVFFMKRHQLPSDVTSMESNPYGVQSYTTPAAGGWYPTQWGEPVKGLGIGKFFGDVGEDVGEFFRERKTRRQTRRGIRKQGSCFYGKCYDEDGNVISEAEYGGDISIPNLQEGNWLKKYVEGGEEGPGDDIKGIKKFVTNWNNSKMGKQMLEASVDKDDPVGINSSYANKIRDQRNSLVNSADVNVTDKAGLYQASRDTEEDSPGLGGFARPKQSKYNQGFGKGLTNLFSTPSLLFNDGLYQKTAYFEPENYQYYVHSKDFKDHDNPEELTPETLIHEVSHASDYGGFFIPDSDKKKMDLHAYGVGKWSPSRKKLNDFQSYVADPTETRARLMNFRYNAANQKLYNPFEQKINLEQLNKYKETEGGYDPLNQLRDVYSDQQIVDMLNSVSKAEPMQPRNTDMAKYGGWIDKYAPGGVTNNCPAGFSKNAFGVCVNASGQNPDQAAASKNTISNIVNPPVVAKKSIATPYKTRSQEVKEATDRAYRENYNIGEFSNQASIGQGYTATPESEARRKKLNEQYASTHPYAKIDNQGNLSRAQWDRNMEGVADPNTPAAKLDRGLDALATGLETASALTGAGQIGSNLLRLGASSLEKKIGRNLLSKNIKNFTSKVNPTLNAIDEAAAYVQMDPVGIMGNRLNSKFYNPTTALNTANNTITGVNRNLTNSAIEGVDIVAGQNNLKNVTGKQSFGEMFRSGLSLEKPKEGGLEFMNRWYRNPKIMDRYQMFRNPSPMVNKYGAYVEAGDRYTQAEKLGNARASLRDYVPKTYKDLWKDMGWKTGLENSLTSSGVSYGDPQGIYLSKGLFPKLGRIGQESTRAHELTHLISNNGRLFNTVENDALLSPFNINYKEYKKLYPNSSPSLNPLSKNTAYYLDPTEIHARMNEARMHLGLGPEDVFTPEHYKKVKKDHNWFGMGKLIKDPKRMVQLMNNFYTPAAGLLGVGALGSGAMNNEQSNQEQKYGGQINWLNKYK